MPRLSGRRGAFWPGALTLLVLIGATLAVAQDVVRTADITVRGLKDTDFPRITKLAANVYAFEQLHPKAKCSSTASFHR